MKADMESNVDEDLRDRSLPRWFDDAKFGIFIHWGVCSVPAWAPLERRVTGGHVEIREPTEYVSSIEHVGSQTAAHHAEHYGDAPYDAFGDRFREALRRWSPEGWADLIDRAGARYVVLTVKLEDGFLLWPSRQPNPHKERWFAERDVVRELAAALDTRGIRLGVYYTGFDWTFSPIPPPAFDFEEGAAMPQGAEWTAYAQVHWRELIERYRPAVLWADYGFPADEGWGRLLAWYVQRVPDGVINDRFGPWDDRWDEERLEAAKIYHDVRTVETWAPRAYDYDPSEDPYAVVPTDKKWESCRAMGRAWAYNQLERDEHYTGPEGLVKELVDVTAHGGNFLLNVGPTASGAIPWLQAQRLLGVGWWLRRYGSAIYGTRPWQRPVGVTAEGHHVRFTASDDAVHAIVLSSPERGVQVPSIELDVRLDPHAEVFLEDRPMPLVWESTPTGVRIDLSDPPDEQPALALRLTPNAAVHAT